MQAPLAKLAEGVRADVINNFVTTLPGSSGTNAFGGGVKIGHNSCVFLDSPLPSQIASWEPNAVSCQTPTSEKPRKLRERGAFLGD